MQNRQNRLMTIHLTPGSIGVKADPKELIELAHYFGYEAVEPNPVYLASLSDEEVRKLREYLEARHLVFGNASLRVDFRGDEEKFTEGMKTLPDDAKALERAGVTRVSTWLRPAHDQLTYRQNFDQHVRRLSAIAKLLAAHNQRLGIEYVGPKTSWSSQHFPFIHTMVETKELIAAMGQSNVGFVLDSWHWYTAHETKQDLLTLKNSDVVSVDLNDAPAGIPVDEQKDNSRELPCATGVIDLASFMNALQEIGYDGPMRAEPFNAELRKLPREEALAVTLAAMQKAVALIKS